MRIIIVAGSKYHNFNTYNYVDGDLFIGIEDGAYEIIKRGYKLSLSIGDFDTTTHLDEILKSSIEIKKYPKDLTRFKLIQDIEKQRLLHKRVRKNFPKRHFQKTNIRTR